MQEWNFHDSSRSINQIFFPFVFFFVKRRSEYLQLISKERKGERRRDREIDSSTSAFFDDRAFPFGGGQLGRIVLIVVDYLNAVQLARRAAKFGNETFVDGVQVTLEQGVVAGRVAHVLVVSVRRELGVMAFAFTHEDVDLARFQYPIKAGQLTKVDLE